MRVKQIRLTIILGTISLLGIIIIQIYWLFTIWNSNQNKLDDQIWQALKQVSAETNEYNDCQTSYQNPVIQTTESCYVVDVSCTYSNLTLQHLITKSFYENEINIEYELANYNCDINSLEYIGKFSENGDLISKHGNLDICVSEITIDAPYYFCINLSGKMYYLLKQIRLWLILSFFVLIIVSFFSYAIFTSFRQKQLNELQKDFINNMTHEFKTPISSIGIASDVLLNSKPGQIPERFINYARIIKQENERLNSQVENVLKAARIEKTKTIIEKEPVDLHELIEEVFSNENCERSDKKIGVHKNLQASSNTIHADKLHITNILLNLFDNAVKYSNDDLRIYVNTVNKGNKIHLSIMDSGIGINKKYHKKIFDKFFRVPTGDLHDIKGFGLGLFYVKEICRLHGWKITLNSEQGKGTTFDFVIETI